MEPCELQNELVSAEGRNRKAVLCQRCGSRVLQPGTALFSRRQVIKCLVLLKSRAAQSNRAAPGWSWLSGFWRPRPSSRFLTPPHVVRLRPTDWAGDKDLGVPARLPGPLHFLSRGVVLQRVHLSYAAHLPPGLGYLAGSSGPNLSLLLPGALANLLYPASVYLQSPLGVAPEHLRIT